MKPIFLFVLFLCCSFFSKAQTPGEWTWIHGNNTLNALGIFGTQGIPSPMNHPPCLYEACEWKDRQGNFWIYGGENTNLSYCDLWKYNPQTNEWTWVKGNGLFNQVPVYGTQGVPNINNTPGGRGWGCATFIDTSGNLWLFGGALSNFTNKKNDLWRYDITANEWTWMGGSTTANQPGVHGTQGIPSIGNHPGARAELNSCWIDSTNNLWIFGGYGFDEVGTLGLLDDVMKFNLSTSEWTWIKGSAIANAGPIHGIMGVPNSNNRPGSRFTYSKWKDDQNNFWIMGGGYYGGNYNDVWKFDLTSYEWTWMNGPNSLNDLGSYNTKCIYDSSSYPAGRSENRSVATDNCGKFWMFGGGGIDDLNDLWIFDPVQLHWNWISGTNTHYGSYGLLGVSSLTNLPPGRNGAVAWWGNDNRFYLFGGYINGDFYSDLWVYTPDSICTGCATFLANFISNQNNICSGTCIDFQNLSFNSTNYQWTFPGGIPNISTSINPSNICYTNPGSYDVTLIASNANGSDTLTLQNYITVFPQPAAQSITQSFDTLFAIAGSSSYQWYFNGSIISGATDYLYVAQSSGDYNVVATDVNGCEVEAVINNVLAHAQLAVSGWQLAIFPNPVQDKFTIHDSQFTIGIANTEISIYNVMGEKVMEVSPLSFGEGLGGEAMWIVDCQSLSSGLYYLELKADEKIFRSKFVKQ